MKNGAILIVDDNKVEVRLCEEALKDVSFDHPIRVFYDGESAYEFIRVNWNHIFMIICDINMPRMTGIEVLEKINAHETLKLASIPFIFLTNSATPKDIEHAYTLAAQGYFQKPMTIEELTDLFRRMVDYWSVARIPREIYS